MWRRLSARARVGVRLFWLVVVSAVIASVLSASSWPGTPGGPAAPRVVPVAEALDAASAVLAARLQGSRVAIADQRTPTREVFANPGGTMTAELTAVPTRVRRGDAWVPVDTSMVSRPDGLVGPRAAVGDLSLSGGGSVDPLARLVKDGRSVALHWPGTLPAPRLDGATATYPEVLPGVDLAMVATRNGLRQHVVVKKAEAARNPALARIALRVESPGLRLSIDESGVLRAVDEAGTPVFEAPPPEMWDSSGPDPANPATARSARVGVSLADGVLTLVPDQKFLSDPAVVFPVTVDPAWATFDKNAWATVLDGNGKRDSSYWWTSGEDPWAQVGQCYRGSPDRCNGIGAARAYFQFDTGFLNGKTVLEAALNTTVVYSPSCGARTHAVWWANGQINPGTTWNNQPGGWWVSDMTAPVVYDNGNCGGWKALGFNVTGAITGAGTSGYRLNAADEGDMLAWRKYNPGDTKLVVRYNQRPYQPTGLRTDPPLPVACRWCGGTPYIGDASIRLIATLSDPDGDQVSPQWDIYTNGQLEQRGWGLGFQGSGAAFDTTVDLQGRDGKMVDWYVRAGDGTTAGDATRSPGPYFSVDRTGVSVPPTVSGVVYQSDNRWHGGLGVPDTFTFGANGVGDIDHYLWGWSDPPSTPVNAATRLSDNASVQLTPPGDGPRDLFVQSVDRAGHRSPTKAYHFYVRAGNGPLAQWSFEGNANDTAFLGDRHGTPHGNVSYGPGAIGAAAQFDGRPGTDITAPNAVRTDASFSVMAWVKLTDASGSGARAVVSQDGTDFAGFDLWYRQDRGGKWVFGMRTADTRAQPGGNADTATSSLPGQVGVWTHLTGVYDAPNSQLRLYVNGALSGTAPRTVPSWNASGPLRIGQTIWDGSHDVDPWPGLIDEVQVYDRVVSEAEARAAVGRDNVQAAYWRFDEAADATGSDFGTTARNDIEGGGMGVLTNGASFVKQGAVKGAVQLDGVDDHVVTSGPAVRTDQSFSVAAWVKADRFTPSGSAMTAVSQDGNRNSGFYLKYDGGQNKWIFMQVSSDDDNPNALYVSAAQTPQLGQWTHLAGVFDAPSRQLRIYVNGELGATATLTGLGAWNATGPLAIGRAKLNGQLTDYWPGAVDEVRVYSRVVSAEEVRGIVSQANVTVGLWKLDGTASDGSGQGHHGTLVGDPAWTAGQSAFPGSGDMALLLDGVDDHMRAASPVNAMQSFSVSVWARLDRPGSAGGKPAVVSQDGNLVSAFKLRATDDGHWSFAMYGADANNAARSEVTGGAVQLGVWTHLAAVYSRERQRIELYVNGDLFGSAERTDGFGCGEAVLGRAKSNGSLGDYFPGAIDDVAIYNRPLFADEIRTVSGRDLSLVHNWRLDESSGTNAADAVGGRAGTLAGGAAFVPGRAGNGVRLDGVNDVVSTTGVDLRTDQSFTVTTWVYLNGNTCDLGAVERCRLDAVSVDGTRTSKFRLGHVVDSEAAFRGKWIFEMPESDADDAVSTAALSVLSGELNTWVHLTGVYDATAQKVWLYVNGVRVADGTLNNPWQATGGLQIGRGKANGAAAEFWPGQVDDVRLYTGVLSKDRISTLVVSYGTQPGSLTLPVADAGYWKFDEATGTTAADSSGRGLIATLHGGAGWRGGRSGWGGQFDGTSGYVDTAGAVLNTSQSFSVAAWVYPSNQSSGMRAVIGQDGTQVSAFTLEYRASDSRFVVRVPTTDQNNPGAVLLASAEQVVAGQWSHVTVVYHREIGWLCLYVNGALSAIQNGVTVLGSGGRLSIGRSRWNGANAEFFNGVIDDVRAYQSGLWDGEVRKIHDDVYLARQGYWRFDGTSVDASGRNNQTTVSGGASYTQGVNGQALQLDGVSGTATTQYWGVPMTDSFTVSAWARLTSADRVQTVLGQDGARMSGFALQYRPELNRWVFAVRAQDSDSATLLYAVSPQPPALNGWTHLTGVYDYPGRQLRLYVDGQLAGTRDNVRLWPAWSGFTVGRGKVNGAPAEFFAGAIDEVIADMGAASDAEVLRRVSYAPPSGGQLVRFVNAGGDHYTANSAGSFWQPFTPVPPGYRVDRSLGMLLSSQQPDTRLLYACMNGAKEFTSTDPACEGNSKLADLGWAYTQQPTSPPTVPLYRCRSGADHFDSVQSTCETTGAVNEMVLGYTVGYAPLTWYYNRTDWEMRASLFGAPVGYENMATLGIIALTAQPGTQQLWSCLDGADGFVSVDAGCEGKTVVARLGWIWTQPPAGAITSPLYRCILSTGDRFMDRSAHCSGATLDRQLGYVLDWLSGGNPAMAAGDGPPPPVTLPPEVVNPVSQPF